MCSEDTLAHRRSAIPDRPRPGSRPRCSATRGRSARRDARRAPGRRSARSRGGRPRSGGSPSSRAVCRLGSSGSPVSSASKPSCAARIRSWPAPPSRPRGAGSRRPPPEKTSGSRPTAAQTRATRSVERDGARSCTPSPTDCERPLGVAPIRAASCALLPSVGMRVERQVVRDERGMSAAKSASSRPRSRASTTSGSFRQKSPWWTSTSSAPSSAARSKSSREQETPHAIVVTSARADDLKALRGELRAALDLEQLVRVARRSRPLAATAQSTELTATLCALGVWRSLVARSVRVGEVPSSNLGTPIRPQGRNPLADSCREYRLRRGTSLKASASRPQLPSLGGAPGSRGLSPVSSLDASRRSARRRLHALPARAGARAGGVPAGRGAARDRARPRALRGRAARGLRGLPGTIPSSCTTRTSGSGSRRTSSAGWAATASGAAGVRDRHRPGMGAARELLPLRRRAARARGPARARPAHRARLERPARPRRVRAPPRTRRRRVRGLDAPRPRQAAPLDLRGRARRRSARRRRRPRWWGTATRTTSRAPARSGCARSSLDREGLHTGEPDRIDTLLALPAALGLGVLGAGLHYPERDVD